MTESQIKKLLRCGLKSLQLLAISPLVVLFNILLTPSFVNPNTSYITCRFIRQVRIELKFIPGHNCLLLTSRFPGFRNKSSKTWTDYCNDIDSSRQGIHQLFDLKPLDALRIMPISVILLFLALSSQQGIGDNLCREVYFVFRLTWKPSVEYCCSRFVSDGAPFEGIQQDRSCFQSFCYLQCLHLSYYT